MWHGTCQWKVCGKDLNRGITFVSDPVSLLKSVITSSEMFDIIVRQTFLFMVHLSFSLSLSLIHCLSYQEITKITLIYWTYTTCLVPYSAVFGTPPPLWLTLPQTEKPLLAWSPEFLAELTERICPRGRFSPKHTLTTEKMQRITQINVCVWEERAGGVPWERSLQRHPAI